MAEAEQIAEERRREMRRHLVMGGLIDDSIAGIEPSEEQPQYRMEPHDDGSATQLWFIVCNEGWRESIVCERMYGWAAEWLLRQIQGQPFAKGSTP